MRVTLICLFLGLRMLCFGQRDENRSLKILSWNIFMLPAVAAKTSPCQRATGIGQCLCVRDYDVIVFQEAFSARSRAIIYSQLREIYPYSAGPANQKILSGKTNSGIWILSRYPILRSQSISFRSREGADALSRKGALMAEVNFKGIKIQIIGTHLQSAGNSGIRELQCQQIFRELLQPNQGDSIPQIICGDMNIDKYSSPEAYSAMLQALHAKDSEMKTARSFSFDPISNDVCKDLTQKSKLIDYILAGNDGLGTTSIQGNVALIKKRWDPSHQDLSDHYAMEAEIMLNKSIFSTVACKNKSVDTGLNADVPLITAKTFFVVPEYQRFFYHGSYESAVGFSALVSTSPKWKFGIGGYLNMDALRSEQVSNVSRAGAIRLIGAKIDYSIYQNKFINVSIPILTGLGSVIMFDNNVPHTRGVVSSVPEKFTTGHGTFIKPTLNVEIKLTKRTYVFAGTGFLLFTDHDNKADDGKPIVSFSSGMRIGLFDGSRPR